MSSLATEHETHRSAAGADEPLTLREKLIASWGVLWVLLLLGNAVFRLAPRAIEPWQNGSMSAFQQTLWVLWALFNAYAEGYRGFQLRFSPRVVARAFHLGRNPRPLHVALALPFCMSLFHSTRRQKIVSWTLIAVIATLVILVRQVDQPWRGIVDGGVVVGLAWGMASVVVFWVRGLLGRPPVPQDLPSRAPIPDVVPSPAE